MTLLNPQCEHEKLGHKLAREHWQVSELRNIAETLGNTKDYATYTQLRKATQRALDLNITDHRNDCEATA